MPVVIYRKDDETPSGIVEKGKKRLVTFDELEDLKKRGVAEELTPTQTDHPQPSNADRTAARLRKDEAAKEDDSDVVLTPEKAELRAMGLDNDEVGATPDAPGAGKGASSK